jgi:carbon-monoxide dehydrogenase small subunit
LIDDRPMRACLSLAVDVEGAQIVTVEGLSAGRELSSLQQAMVENGAVQCGFCTAGMLITAHALLRDNPRPDPEQVRAGLAGNLCRCSGYGKIIEAVCRAAEESSR